MYQTIKTEQHDRVLVARFSNPPHQFIDDNVMTDLRALIDDADKNPDIGVVVLTGDAPDRFLAHYDIADIVRKIKLVPAMSEKQASTVLTITKKLLKIPGMNWLLRKTPLDGVVYLLENHNALSKIGRSGTIFISAINGETAGGGIEISMACDIRFMSEQANLSQIEIHFGFPPGFAGTQRLSRLIGRANALEMMLTGRCIEAAEAKQLGLATQVFEHDSFLENVLTYADKISRFSSHGVSAIKRATIEGGSLPLEQGLHIEHAAMFHSMALDTTVNAMENYVESVEKEGLVPAYNPPVREQFESGHMTDFQVR